MTAYSLLALSVRIDWLYAHLECCCDERPQTFILDSGERVRLNWPA